MNTMSPQQTAAANLRRGDRVFFQYGCMCGEDVGTVLEVLEPTEWGPRVLVRVQDFTTKIVGRLDGTVRDMGGWFEGDSQIGAYRVEAGS